MSLLLHQLLQPALRSLLLACIAAGAAFAAAPEATPAAALRARYAALSAERSSPFQRPLYLDSVESAQDLRGDIFALVDYPFSDVNAALAVPANWCDLMILHINTKYCRAVSEGPRTTLQVSIGKKTEQALDDAFRVSFAYRLAAATPEYLAVQLNAENGPLGTSNYRIVLEAVPADATHTLLHLSYAYAYGLSGRLGMQAYLATGGRGKVGFTIEGQLANGAPGYIGGVRGVVERNTMRYFLAIDAYLGTLDAAPADRLEKRLHNWYAATERYARQLHEVERGDYLAMKRSEYRRQQTVEAR